MLNPSFILHELNNRFRQIKIGFCCVGYFSKFGHYAAIAQLVEHQLPKLRAEGSNPFCRSNYACKKYFDYRGNR